MIIVKTKNGDQFVNDKEMKVAAHDRSARTVKLWGIDMKSPLMTFEEVESVNYFSDAQPCGCCWTGARHPVRDGAIMLPITEISHSI